MWAAVQNHAPRVSEHADGRGRAARGVREPQRSAVSEGTEEVVMATKHTNPDRKGGVFARCNPSLTVGVSIALLLFCDFARAADPSLDVKTAIDRGLKRVEQGA